MLSTISKIQIGRLYLLYRLIKRLIQIQIDAIFYLVLFIIMYTHKNIKNMIKRYKKETTAQKIFNYFMENQDLIVQNCLLLLINPSSPYWYMLQAYTFIRIINKPYEEISATFVASFLGFVKAIILGQV